MCNQLTRIYTRTGDDGTTGLRDRSRTDKSSLRIEVIGDIDEVNSIVSIIRAQELTKDINLLLMDTQHTLFDIGSELSLPGHSLIKSSTVSNLEQAIDRLSQQLPPLKQFILPGGNEPASICHFSRSICRRAERHLVKLAESEDVNEQTLKFLNRLSDLLFVIARILVKVHGDAEIYWDKNRIPYMAQKEDGL